MKGYRQAPTAPGVSLAKAWPIDKSAFENNPIMNE